MPAVANEVPRIDRTSKHSLEIFFAKFSTSLRQGFNGLGINYGSHLRQRNWRFLGNCTVLV